MKLLFDDIKLVLVKLTGGFDQPILTKFLKWNKSFLYQLTGGRYYLHHNPKRQASRMPK